MIIRSLYPDPAIPDVALAPFVLSQARQRGAKPALIDGPSGRTITYEHLAGAVERAAAGFAGLGLRKGDVVAIFSPNLPEYAVALLGAISAGVVVTTVNPLYTVEELAHQLNDSGARALITLPSFLDKASEAARQAKVEHVLVFGEADGATPFSSLLDETGPAPQVSINPREDLAALPYSSGTTGLSKGVMLTHYNLVANLCQIQTSSTLIKESDTLIAVLPFFHIYGLVVILNLGLLQGATIVTMPRFGLEEFLAMMERYQISVAQLVPPIVLALAKQPMVERFNLSRLRWVMSGAAPLGEETARACAERLRCGVVQGYGLTETSPVSHISPTDPARVRISSVGHAVAGTECRVVDLATGEDLGPNQRGEIWTRGPQVMKGYWRQPEATAATIDPEGWLRTGDIGYVDEDGYFYIVDRAKELIKYKGYQVAPAELEELLLTHPSIADAAVIPSPDEEAGEVPKAFVTLKAPLSEEEILRYVAERVAPHKKIRRVEIIEQIPKLPSGKILRRVLVERERGGI